MRGATADILIIDEGLFFENRYINPVIEIARPRHAIMLMMCSPSVEEKLPDEMNVFEKQLANRLDFEGRPLLSEIAYTSCAMCERRTLETNETVFCGHIASDFPWITPTRKQSIENTVRRASSGRDATAALSPVFAAAVFTRVIPDDAVEPMFVVAIDPGDGASLTTAVAATLTRAGVVVHGLLRTDDRVQQVAQVLSFCEHIRGMLPRAKACYVYVERNLAGVSSALLTALHASKIAGLVCMREPHSITAGMGVFTTQASKNWLGHMFRVWITRGWIGVSPALHVAAWTPVGAIPQARAFVADEFVRHTQAVEFGATRIEFKVQRRSDDWVCAFAFVLHAFVLLIPSLRPLHTQLTASAPGRLRYDEVIGLHELLRNYFIQQDATEVSNSARARP